MIPCTRSDGHDLVECFSCGCNACWLCHLGHRFEHYAPIRSDYVPGAIYAAIYLTRNVRDDPQSTK